MPGQPRSRSLPDRPNLRHLKLEAKRRLAAGEFGSLHDTQVAIAREHGLPSWTSLKQLVCARAGEESHALDQLRWVIARFARADEPGWAAPGPDELAEHFDERFLAEVPPPTLVATISKLTKDLRDGELVVLGRAPLQAYVQLGSLQYVATVEPGPPHRFTSLRGIPIGSRVHDPRVADLPVRTRGHPPAAVPEIAEQAVAELGIAALSLAGGDPGRQDAGQQDAGQQDAGQDAEDANSWVLTRGWADLDRAEPLDPAHRFQAAGVTVLVTATAVLRLVAGGELSLDRRANEFLRTMRLADDTITVRDLLSHTAGVDNPSQLYADTVPDLAEFLGPVVACTGPRGTIHPSNGGAAVLGQLVADATGMPYARAAADLILQPLGMHDSAFPARPSEIGPNAVTGYNLTLEGVFTAIPARIPTLQAVAGLWSTGADLVRLGLGWSSLLPGALAHEALTPQTGPGPGGTRVGLGWLISPRGDVAIHAGANLDATASLTTRIRDGRTHVVLTSRMLPVNTIEARLLRAWTNPDNA